MLFNYFLEIKNRSILLVVCWVFSTCIAYLNKEALLFLVVKVNISNNFYFISTNVIDVFTSYLNIVYFVSLHLSLFLIIYHILMFIYPALYVNEKKNLQNLVSLILIFWVFGVLIFNLTVLPFCWKFFLSFYTNSSKIVDIFFEAKITEYLKLYFLIYYSTVLSLQFFVLIFLVLSMINKRFFIIKKTRKLFLLLFFLIATLLTPPDVVSQLVLGICFIVIYEVIIVINIIKLL